MTIRTDTPLDELCQSIQLRWSTPTPHRLIVVWLQARSLYVPKKGTTLVPGHDLRIMEIKPS